MANKDKFIIYQMFPRHFGNTCQTCRPNGDIKTNGVGKMNDISSTALKEIKSLGATHIWYTGVIEHATKTDYSEFGIKPDNAHVVKGNAGSPYAIKDYYDIDPDIAVDIPNRMKEFEALVARTHAAKLKVLIDFVPNHVARQYHSDCKPKGIADLGEEDNTDYGFNPNNNFYYITRQLFSPSIDLGSGEGAYYEFPAKATGNDCFHAFPSVNDWYETVKLNYGVDYGNGSTHFDPIPNTWFKMLHILRFWASKGIDGFRCDMAFMVPTAFWNWAIPQIKEKYPNIIFIAEIYNVGQYREFIFDAHFDYLYDKVNLYDTLRAIQCNGVSAAAITNCWQAVDGIGNKLLNFLENHDEQRTASKFFVGNAMQALPSVVVGATISTGPYMIYSGQELGEEAKDAEGFSGLDGRTTIFDYWSVPTVRRWYNEGKCDGALLTQEEIGLRNEYKKILNLSVKEAAIAEGKFYDLMYVNYQNPNLDPHRIYTYLRATDNEYILIAVNFAGDTRKVAINIPEHAFQFLELPQGKYNAKDLLTDEKETLILTANEPVEITIPPFGARILKFKKTISKKSLKK